MRIGRIVREVSLLILGVAGIAGRAAAIRSLVEPIHFSAVLGEPEHLPGVGEIRRRVAGVRKRDGCAGADDAGGRAIRAGEGAEERIEGMVLFHKKYHIRNRRSDVRRHRQGLVRTQARLRVSVVTGQNIVLPPRQ